MPLEVRLELRPIVGSSVRQLLGVATVEKHVIALVRFGMARARLIVPLLFGRTPLIHGRPFGF
jgi:hypothetical protein